MKKYTPKSHFFSDLSGLADSSGIDGFGPVNGFLATKFRVTSKVKSNTVNPVKLYAVCDGRMLIQPSTDSSKINIIIKPSANNYSPLKIKYFIYRGVKKSDYFTNDILNQPDYGKPETLSKIWAMLVALNGLPSTIGYIFPLSFVYDHSAPATQHIDDALQKSLVFCKEGDYIGNFTSEVGLDIVLDHGDYILENQEVLFNFNLEFAREPEFIFNTENISGNVNKKRYKEHIHQFLDAAAFWGSHIDCGEIKFKSGLPATTVAGVSPILKKYITGDKLYIYVQGEDNRTFNYFDSNRKIYGFETNGENNIKEGWPILIKDSLVNGANKIDFGFDYIVHDIKIQKPERNISVDCIAPNLDLHLYPITQRVPDSALSGKTANVSITFPKTASAFCASFAFFSVRTYQKFPVVNYFNHLWIANIKNSVNLDPANIKMQWFTYDRNRNINLDDTIEGSAIIQNKVIIDEGKNSAGQIKRRRLYAAIIKNNSTKDQEHNEINIDKVASGFVKDTKNAQTYFLNLFNGEKDYSLYKGSFTDSQNLQIINSLSAFHENSLSKRKSYLFLGITEDEYNQFSLPSGADNCFFDLLEETGFNSENVRKFKLGIRYEYEDATTGQISNSIVYSNPNIFVYSIDDLFFFSKEFSSYQNFFYKFPKAYAEFIIKQPFDGEFGFDWMRKGNNSSTVDYAYKDIISKQYKAGTTILLTSPYDINEYQGDFKSDIISYKKLEKKYSFFPMQWEALNKLDRNYLSILNIYPPYVPKPISIDLDRQAIFKSPYNDDINRVAKIQIRITIKEKPTKISLKYDDRILSILPANPIISTNIGNHIIDLTIKAKQKIIHDSHVFVQASYEGKNKIIGAMKVSSNDDTKRKTKKAVIILVKTNITGSTVSPSLLNKALDMKKYLRQAFITPILEQIDIDMTNSIPNNYIHTSPTGVKSLIGYDETGLSNISLHKLITGQNVPGMNISIENYYNDHFFCIFFLERGGKTVNDPAINNFKGLNGYAAENKYAVQFYLATNTTPSHEFLHALGVAHSFTNYEVDNNAIYTYIYNRTDNILDYSSDRKLIWEWQGEIARKNSDNEYKNKIK